MKYLIFTILCITGANCGLLKSVLGAKSDENKPEVLNKVVNTLDNGTTIIVDALGNIITVHKDEKGGVTKEKVKTTTEISATEVTTPKMAENDTEINKIDETNVDKVTEPIAEADKSTASKGISQNGTTTEELTKDTSPISSTTTDKVCTGNGKNVCENGARRNAFRGDQCPSGKSKGLNGDCVAEE